MKRTKRWQRLLSLAVCMALLIGYIPLSAKAAAQDRSVVVGAVADPGSADSWQTMMGTAEDGNRYAGRVWADKSVYTDGDIAILNNRGEAGSSFQVDLEEDEDFQIIFSALGSTMTNKSTVTSNGPMDVVLVLDDSTSMDDIISDNTTRLAKLVEASNDLLEDLLTAKDIRIGIVAYNTNSITVLPFGQYQNGVELRVKNNKFTFSEYSSGDKGGTIQAFDQDGTLLYNNQNGYSRGTNLQAGLNEGLLMLEGASNVQGRTPVAIVLTDGASNTAVQKTFYKLGNQTPRRYSTNNVPAAIALATLLTGAYRKAAVEDVYGIAPVIYGVGVDLDNNAAANAVINPGAATNGFNSKNSNKNITEAYELYTQWITGKTVNRTESSYQFTFDHGYQNQSDITLEDIKKHIHYVDTYYPVSSAKLNETFDQIFEELSSGVFNPISTTTSASGGNGVDNTPLIYVDFIGQHMQIKEIQAVTLFGNSYGVVKKADGSYTVTEATGTNPTTNELWNTAEDIRISVLEQEDGTQKLEIRINQEILPIILEQAVTETVGNASTSTITELSQAPLRVYYTVGMDSEILLPSGQVDVSKIQGYDHIDDAAGTVSFYANRFGVMNDGITNGDAHVGFKPSLENRYYYHQNNQGIFTKITDKDGSEVTVSENDQYGILWDENRYDLTWMTYQEYLAAKDTDKVYTYVTYCRPTSDKTDDNNAAEEVTYLVYTDWQYLKESVAFYDAAKGTYLNDGAVGTRAQVEDYLHSNPKAQLYAVLGVGSLRTSRLHNMTVGKNHNSTDTAMNRYAPEYTHETAAVHNGNDVVVWLGNNGKLTVRINTGIALTKAVTETIGNESDTYALTVTIPQGVDADPVAVDDQGNSVRTTYDSNLLTVYLRAGQTAYISGIPGGTECLIGEVINGDYYIHSQTERVLVPLISEALNGQPQFAPAVVTNAPKKYGNLFITKEITSDHVVPESVMNTAFEISVNLGAEMAGKMVTVSNSEREDLYGVTVNENGNVTFRIKARQTIELLRLPAGTPISVTESDPGSHFEVSYRTRNHSGEPADSDNNLVIPSTGSATAVVMNHYTPTPVTVDLDIAGTKIFTAEGDHEGGKFVYKVQQWNGTAWEDLEDKTAQTPYAENESGTKTFTIENVLEGITYTQVGSHAYQVLEVKGQSTNVTFDRTLYTFTVTVTDRGGELAATVADLNNNPITDGTYEVTFHNTYHTEPVSVDIVKEVDNRSGDLTVSKAGFEFHAVRTDAQWNVLEGEEASELIVFTDGAGEARLTATYHTEGSYHYVLTEINKNAPGWSYSNAQYRITVTVTEHDGNLVAALEILKTGSDHAQEVAKVDAEDPTSGFVSFVNTYDPEDAAVDLSGSVLKELTGKTLEEGQFTFLVYADGDRTTPLLTGTNNAAGEVSFDQLLTFEQEGKYQFDVLEQIPTEAVYDPASDKYVLNGMSYDPTVYDLVIEVTNHRDTGTLVADSYFEDAVTGTVTFHNRYKASPVTYELGAQKILYGRAIRNGEFTFELYEGDTLKQTTTNLADGSIRFQPITYTQVGTYRYTVKEVAGDVAGISYQGAENPVTVTVTVTDENGILRASADLANQDIKFENTYSAQPAQVIFNGTKTLVGGALEDNSFTFRLYRTDFTFDVANGQLLATAQNVDGAFRFENTLTTAGTYYFVVLEEAGENADVVYDRTRYQLDVRVTDVGNGQLQATVKNTATGQITDLAASVEADVAFTNAMVDVVTKKEAYLAGDVTTEIDGQQVKPGDILTYRISYTNYTGGDVTVIITDQIPEHTTYVEGSITHNGSHSDGYVNWIFNLSRGRSYTVSFDVRVDEPEVLITNTAVVRDGTNTYHTNEVVNHTVKTVLDKDVFAATDPTVSIDGKQVQEGDELIYKLSFTNTSAETRDVQIRDRIPENVTYVADSADNGGICTEDVLLWNLEQIPAWSTVTVSFKVTVNTGIGNATIDNQATATDGSNSYESRWVSNYTEEIPEEPEDPEPPKPSIPKTDDQSLLLWMTILILSCGALITLLTLGKTEINNET